MKKYEFLANSKRFLMTLLSLSMLAGTVKVCGCSSDMDDSSQTEESSAPSEDKAASPDAE